VTTLIDYALVSRLRQAYWPLSVFGMYTLPRVLKARPRRDFIPEDKRIAPGVGDAYHLGRVKYFYDLLRTGEAVDPIEVESECYATSWGGSACWGGPSVHDGHHRYAAAVLAKKRRIAMSFGGIVSTRDWLVGKRHTPPPELYS
jgi:hypothetical protein